MKFDKDFNPGTNNTYNEVNMGNNSIYVPGVTNLTIVNGGKPEDKVESEPKASLYDRMREPDENKDLTVAKRAILNYTSRIASMLKPEWMQGWERFWTGLLGLDVIENDICDITKQQGTTFNRMFICKIIHHLSRRDFFKETYNASAMTRALEGDSDHSIRTHGLNLFPDDDVCKRIDSYIEDFKL